MSKIETRNTCLDPSDFLDYLKEKLNQVLQTGSGEKPVQLKLDFDRDLVRLGGVSLASAGLNDFNESVDSFVGATNGDMAAFLHSYGSQLLIGPIENLLSRNLSFEEMDRESRAHFVQKFFVAWEKRQDTSEFILKLRTNILAIGDDNQYLYFEDNQRKVELVSSGRIKEVVKEPVGVAELVATIKLEENSVLVTCSPVYLRYRADTLQLAKVNADVQQDLIRGFSLACQRNPQPKARPSSPASNASNVSEDHPRRSMSEQPDRIAYLSKLAYRGHRFGNGLPEKASRVDASDDLGRQSPASR